MPDRSAIVDAAITSRRSSRAYLPTPVAGTVIERFVSAASRAPSGTYARPWRAHVLTDKARMHAPHGRSYAFFDERVGLIFAIDRDLRQRRWLGNAMFLEDIMVSARRHGRDTCVQAAFMHFHRIIAEHVGAAPTEQVVCGMSLDYADPNAIEYRLVTDSAPVRGFALFPDRTPTLPSAP